MSFAPLPGSSVTIGVAADDPDDVPGSFTAVVGIKEATFAPTADLQDATTFGQGNKAKHKFATLTDGTISLSGFLDTADPGQAMIRSNWLALTPMWIQVLWTATVGHAVRCYAKSITIKGSPDGIVSFEASLEFTDLPVELPET